METFAGYSRPGGRAGLRNHALVLSLVACANSVARRIAEAGGAVAITHEYGCLESAEDSARTRLALLGAARNPNVGAVLLVALGCEQLRAEEFRRECEKAGKPADVVCIQDAGGPPEALAEGTAKLAGLRRELERARRVPCPASALVVGVQCGGSDWTTALVANPAIGAMTDRIVAAGGTVLMAEVGGFSGSEHLVAGQAASREAGLAVLDMVAELRRDFFARTGQRLEEANPTPGNKAGGITTLVEKSVGNIRKMGASPVRGVLRLEDAIPRPGLWVLDQRTQGPDPFVTSGFAIMGATAAVFSSGRGTPVGSAVMPVLKITGNRDGYEAMRSLFDCSVADAVTEEAIRAAGGRLYETLLAVAGGGPTRAEENGCRDFAIPREQFRKKHCPGQERQ